MKTKPGTATNFGLKEPSLKALEAANRIADDFSTGFFNDRMVIDMAHHIDDVFNGEQTELLTTL